MSTTATAAAYPANFEINTPAWEGDHTSYTWQKNRSHEVIIGETAQFYKMQTVDMRAKPVVRRVKKTNVRFAEAAPVAVAVVADAVAVDVETVAAAPAATHFAIVEVPGFEVVAMPYAEKPTQQQAEANFATLHTIGEVQVVTAAELKVMRGQLFGFSYKLREVAAAPAATVASVTTDAASDVVAACVEVFDMAWSKERARLQTVFGHYQHAKQQHAQDGAKNGTYSPLNTSTETYLSRALYGGTEKNRTDAFNDLCHTLYKMDRDGFDATADGLRAYYIDGLTHKLKEALMKHDIQRFAAASDVRVLASAKGFTVSALIDGRAFHTECIGAGGYNIQRFHYRYLVRF
jgi:hypothetical protein